MPVGIIIARFYKDGDGAWFRMHRLIQTLASILNIVAFITIVAYTENNGDTHFALPHQITGLTIFILGVLQPLNGFLRPHKDTDHVSTGRKIWEFAHRWIGRLLVILGIYNINGGMNITINISAFRVIWIVVIVLLGVFYSFKEFQKFGRSKQTGEGYTLNNQ